MAEKSKKIIQDITPPDNKKTIRNIPVPERFPRQSVNQKPKTPSPISPPVSKEPAIKSPAPAPIIPEKIGTPKGPPPIIPVMGTPMENRRWRKKLWPTFLVVVFVALGYGVYLFLHVGATVTVTPKEKVAALNSKFTAKKNPQLGELSFEVITLDADDSKSVPSTGEKTIEKRATGKVIIYNNYNTKTQRLIKNTRLETPDGLIFKIDSSVVVPGQTKQGGSLVPGSIEASVTADVPGDKYNIPLSDFTIPGFKGDPRYNSFYGRSKTAMSGGFEGKVKVASEKDRQAASDEITASLKEKLTKEADAQVPAGFILFDKAAYITTEDSSIPESTDIKIKATLHGIIFNKETLSESIAKVAIPEYYETGEKVLATDMDKLTFLPDSLEISPWDTGNMPFTLSGTTTIRWQIDEEKLKGDLAGIPKIRVDEIFPLYHGIEKAEVDLQPPWKSSLPEDSTRIKIVIKNKAGS